MCEFISRVEDVRYLQWQLMMDYPLVFIVPVGIVVLTYCLMWRLK